MADEKVPVRILLPSAAERSGMEDGVRKQSLGPAFLVIGIMLILIAAYAAGSYRMIRPDENRICKGIYIEDIDVGGMTREEAQAAVNQYVSKLSARSVEVKIGQKTVTATLSELGYACDAAPVLDEAMKQGREGNLFTNYATLRKLSQEPAVYNLEFTYSDKKVKKFISKKCGKKCVSAKNSKIKMKNGALYYTEAREGTAIDTDQTTANLMQALKEQEEAEVVVVEAVVTTEEPAVTKEQASRCKDKLGSFSTTFNAGNVSRSANVANAARLINGSVVYPGETFSVHDVISPLTEDNGYHAAPSYSNGQVVDSIGGGVCQVSTTLYNAVLRAELEVVERSPHSMVVSYVEPSMDAAIAGDYKDFKFRNNTQVPLYIEGGTYSGTIYFNIYGEENRASGRSVTFSSEITETIQPGKDKITYDKTKPASYMQVTQEAHIGYKAVLWKIVTENGETEKTQVNTSTYQAAPKYIVKGGAKTSETTEPEATDIPKSTEKPAKTKEDQGKTDGNKAKPTSAAATKVPKATKAPKVTNELAATATPQLEETDTEDPVIES